MSPLIAPFDPWKDPLCTCPPKYSCSPYTGCGHACLYCYISSYIPRAFEPRPKRITTVGLLRELRKLDGRLPISIANSGDPYTPPEERLLLTRRLLETLVPRGFKIMLLTKSDLVLRDLDLIKRGNVAVSITVTTIDARLARRLEPGAPPPERRIRALAALSRAGVPTVARIDPLIPGINDDERALRRLVAEIALAGVRHVVASTYKARPDSLRRLQRAFPEQASTLRELYLHEGVRVKRTVWYLPEKLRRELLTMVRELVLEAGMTFAVCREGLPELNTAPSCDGTHLIPRRIPPPGAIGPGGTIKSHARHASDGE